MTTTPPPSRGWRLFFVAAGLFNLLGGGAGLLSGAAGLDPPPVYPFAFQLLFLAVMILGAGYLAVAWDPARNRPIVWIGLATKLAGFTVTYLAIHDGQLPAEAWWQPIVNDGVWMVGFALYLWRVRPSSSR